MAAALRQFSLSSVTLGSPARTEIMLLKASPQSLELVGCLFNPVSAFYLFIYLFISISPL